jgi:hypothetical protein
MSEFNIRSDSVNVEQIMEQIRARIREKRGVDYTEQQIRELAALKLEKFLDPRGVRSDLLQEFRRGEPDSNYEFEDETLFRSTRAPFLRWIRRLLNPVLKLFFNPNPLIHALHMQSQINDRAIIRHQLYYELIHNLVVEITRLGIEVKNLKMRVESLDARVDFSERRARALEGAVLYRPDPDGRDDREERARPVQPAQPDRGAFRPAVQPASPASPQPAPGVSLVPGSGPIPEGAGQRSKRRRRRRGRRGGGPAASVMGSPPGMAQPFPTGAPEAGDAADSTASDSETRAPHVNASTGHDSAAPPAPSDDGTDDEQ